MKKYSLRKDQIRVLLLEGVHESALKLLHENGYSIGNIDTTICLQQPKVKDFIQPMQQTLADAMGITINDVSVKATTTEKLGFIGKEEGIAVYAVVLINKNN